MESNSFLKVGAMLNHDKYRIERYLASGGFGNTYEGVNVSLGKKCAIKEFFLKGIAMRNEQTTDVHIAIPDNKRVYNSQREKFTKEARRLSSLDNIHIVRVFDFFEENGTAYYVMDYIEGESLREYQKRTGKALTEQEALSVLTQMLDALETIHEAGLQHMDIKPANIMIDQKGKCTLIDFGASKQSTANEGATTTSTTMAYTPGYAPTEQIGGSSDRWGPWTDFYALGATLYNLLTKDNPGELDIEEDGVDTFKFPPDISTPTRSLIQWMMSPKRKDRPQNVGEIRVYLKEKEINAEEPLIAEGGENPISENVAASTKYVAEVEATEIDEALHEDTPTESDGKNTVYVSAASEVDNAVVNQPDDNPKINDEKGKDKKRKSNVGKRVTYFLLSLLIVAGMVFFIKSLDSDKKKETKTEETLISSKKEKSSEGNDNKTTKSKNKNRPIRKVETVRQESQHASSKTPSQRNNPSQERVIIKPYPGKNSDLLRGNASKNNPTVTNQTSSRNSNVTPAEKQQSKSGNATSPVRQVQSEKPAAQGNGQAVRIQNRNANSSTSAQSAKRKQSEIDAAWGNVDNSNSAKANEIDAAW